MDDAFVEIDRILNSIPQGVCGGRQPEFLYHLSNGLQGAGEVVEIGTNVGKSAIALAYGQKIKENGRPIHTIDVYEHADIVSNLEKARVRNLSAEL